MFQSFFPRPLSYFKPGTILTKDVFLASIEAPEDPTAAQRPMAAKTIHMEIHRYTQELTEPYTSIYYGVLAVMIPGPIPTMREIEFPIQGSKTLKEAIDMYLEHSMKARETIDTRMKEMMQKQRIAAPSGPQGIIVP